MDSAPPLDIINEEKEYEVKEVQITENKDIVCSS